MGLTETQKDFVFDQNEVSLNRYQTAHSSTSGKSHVKRINDDELTPTLITIIN